MILALALGLTACGGDQGNLNKLNGKWSGGIVTIEFDANAKTMSTFFGQNVKKQSFTVQSEDGNSITLKMNGGNEIVFTFHDDDTIMTLETVSYTHLDVYKRQVWRLVQAWYTIVKSLIFWTGHLRTFNKRSTSLFITTATRLKSGAKTIARKGPGWFEEHGVPKRPTQQNYNILLLRG